jgi:hypothetical protein
MNPSDLQASPSAEKTTAGGRATNTGAAGDSAWLSDLLLRRHEANLRRIPSATRAELIRRCEVGLQKLQAARILWASEQTAEALQLAAVALVVGVDAAELAAASLTGRTTGDLSTPSTMSSAASSDLAARATRALVHLGAGDQAIAITGIAAALVNTPAPDRNDDVTSAHRRTFAALTAATAALLDAAKPLAETPANVKLRRLGRLATLGLLALVGALAIQRAFAVDESFTIAASGSYDAIKFGPDKAADRDPKTEWLLPSRATGWVEVKFSRRDLRHVHLRNAHNPPFADRGTRSFRLELYREGHLVHSSKHAFSRFDAEPETLELVIKGDDVDGLRILIDDHHKNGGGLSELSWR